MAPREQALIGCVLQCAWLLQELSLLLKSGPGAEQGYWKHILAVTDKLVCVLFCRQWLKVSPWGWMQTLSKTQAIHLSFLCFQFAIWETGIITVFLICLILALAVAVLGHKRLPRLLALPQQAFIPCRCMGCLCSRLWAEFRLSCVFLSLR